MIRKTNQISLADAIQHFIESNKLRQKIDEVSLGKAWAELVGTNIEKYTEQVSIKDSELILKISSPAMRQELSYNTEKLRAKVNHFFGAEKIKTVRLV